MEIGTTELDAAFESDGAIEKYSPEPTFTDAFKASAKNFMSVSLSTSSANYFKEELEKTKSEWLKANPKDETLYNRISGVDKNIIEKLDSLYEMGNLEAIRNWNTSTESSMINVGGIGIGHDYIKFRETQSSKGLTNTSNIISNANENAKRDYYESASIMEESDHWFAETLGTMWGALHDPITLATLPIGTWKAGGTVLTNAGRAAVEEMKIEAMAQSVIVPTVTSFKNELEIKTTIAEEAANAVMAIGTAGLVRGVGSAAFDLTEMGVKALKAKDPELGAEYEMLAKSQATEDLSSHIENLHRAEFDEYGVDEIKNPNEFGESLNKADPIPEFADEEIQTAKNAIESRAQEQKIDPMDFEVEVGVDEAGEKVMKSYRSMFEESDIEEQAINKARECFL